MTESEALNMIQAKLTCMELYDLSCIEEGCDRECENCEYNYAQGNNGEQKEALKVAIQALEKQIPKKPKTDDRYVMYICPCCNDFIKVSHNYCPNCGQRLNWGCEE